MTFLRGLTDRFYVRGTEEMSLTNLDNEEGGILVSTPREGRAGQGSLQWENVVSGIRDEQDNGGAIHMDPS